MTSKLVYLLFVKVAGGGAIGKPERLNDNMKGEIICSSVII